MKIIEDDPTNKRRLDLFWKRSDIFGSMKLPTDWQAQNEPDISAASSKDEPVYWSKYGKNAESPNRNPPWKKREHVINKTSLNDKTNLMLLNKTLKSWFLGEGILEEKSYLKFEYRKSIMVEVPNSPPNRKIRFQLLENNWSNGGIANKILAAPNR